MTLTFGPLSSVDGSALLVVYIRSSSRRHRMGWENRSERELMHFAVSLPSYCLHIDFHNADENNSVAHLSYTGPECTHSTSHEITCRPALRSTQKSIWRNDPYNNFFKLWVVKSLLRKQKGLTKLIPSQINILHVPYIHVVYSY